MAASKPGSRLHTAGLLQKRLTCIPSWHTSTASGQSSDDLLITVCVWPALPQEDQTWLGRAWDRLVVIPLAGAAPPVHAFDVADQ